MDEIGRRGPAFRYEGVRVGECGFDCCGLRSIFVYLFNRGRVKGGKLRTSCN